MTNSEIITKFYSSFQQGDINGMLECYDDHIVFEDPAFWKLEGERAKNMWRMLLANNKGGIKVNFSNVAANDNTGSANWSAEYIFSQSGRKVINKVSAQFEFEHAKIVKHTDSFDLYKWSKQALGIKGYSLGWTSFFKTKLQQQTNRLLDNFEKK